MSDLPRTFGPYALLSVVGRGGMGEVYLAKTGGLAGFEKHCVVKTLRAEAAAEPEYVQRFTEEARVVVQLAHRNICNVFDVGRAQGSLYMAMEHVVGRDLRHVLRAEKLTTAVALYIMTEVLEALDYAHRFVDGTTGQPLALVHRDVSPPNILLGVEGDVKLIDFGVAQTARVSHSSRSGTVLGKLNYMAPEHARGEAVDGRADQWSAAAVLTELLCGVGFYDGLDRDEAWALSGKGTHRPNDFAKIDAGLRTIIDRALSRSRDNRYPNCSAFAEALTGWARANAQIADCRDLRRLLAARFGDLAAEARGVYQATVDLVPAEPGPAGPGASPWESIATTMMIGPPTGEMVADIPGTMVVRSRDKRLTQTMPVAQVRTRQALAAAAGAAAMLVFALVISALRSDPDDVVAPPELQHTKTPIVDAGDLTVPTDAAVIAPIETDPGNDGRPNRPEPDDGRLWKPSGVKTPARPANKYDSLTEGDIKFLRESCTKKVSCAAQTVRYARDAKNDQEKQQAKESVKGCARECRLK